MGLRTMLGLKSPKTTRNKAPTDSPQPVAAALPPVEPRADDVLTAVDVQSCCALVSAPATTIQSPSFRTTRGASAAEWNVQEFDRLEAQLVQSKPPDCAYLIRDVTVFGLGFLLRCDGRLIQESLYLARDIDRRIARSSKQPFTAPDDLTWIVAANASSNNYWHWIAQVLPAILQCRDMLLENGIDRFGLLTPRLVTHQKQCLDLLGFGDTPRLEITADQSVHVRSLAYSAFLSGANVFTASSYRAVVRNAFLTAAASLPRGTARRIYVSRRDTHKRVVLNEAELESALLDCGFDVVRAGDHSVREQVRMFNDAALVVGPHGAGMTNGLFCEPGATVLELAQGSGSNAGPASLCKTSGASLWLDLFRDDGLGSRTAGWEIDIPTCLETIRRVDFSHQSSVRLS